MLGVKFELRTDHESLKYIFTQPLLNNRQRRWIQLLSRYDFDIKHVTGKENKVADALNGQPICNALTIIQSNLIEGIEEEVQRDPFYGKIFQSLHVNPMKMHKGTFHLYRGNLYYLCVPKSSQFTNQIL